MIGMRVKLYSKGSGRWEKSGGEAAKFGLTTTELLEVINRVREAGRIDMLRMLHFHIGSQLTDIKRIKNFVPGYTGKPPTEAEMDDFQALYGYRPDPQYAFRYFDVDTPGSDRTLILDARKL